MVVGAWLISIIIGKKSLLQFTPYDIGILMIISNVVAEPLVIKDSFKSIFGVIVLALCIVALGKISLNKKYYRVDYTPTILIANGVINYEKLKKSHLSVFALASLLRSQGYNISDVNFAILEMEGTVSVIAKTAARPPRMKDLNLTAKEEGISYPVIIDGEIFEQMLPYANITKEWLTGELKASFKAKPKEVFYAEINSENKLFVNLFSQSKP
jgi:uncharacterized membrane protein YcaP (DUF421 family)